MKIAIVADIHSNWEALKSVLKDIDAENIDAVFSLGDIIGYGPYPQECLKEIRKIALEIVQGNHEELVGNLDEAKRRMNPLAYEGIKLSRRNLSEDELDFIQALPTKIIIGELDLTLAHGSYTEPSTRNYVDDLSKVEIEARAIPTRIGVIGHTHIPFVFDNQAGFLDGFFLDDFFKLELDSRKKYIINVGSVGQPRNGDNRACYGIFDYSRGNGSIWFRFRRVEYDIMKAQKAYQLFGLPEKLSQRLFFGK